MGGQDIAPFYNLGFLLSLTMQSLLSGGKMEMLFARWDEEEDKEEEEEDDGW